MRFKASISGLRVESLRASWGSEGSAKVLSGVVKLVRISM